MLNISQKHKPFLWEHPSHRKHPAGWVLSNLSYGQPSPETTIRSLLWIKEQFKKVSRSLQSAHVCPCSPGLLPCPALRAWLSGVFLEGGCEQKRPAQSTGVPAKPPAPKMPFPIPPLPLSSTALQGQTPQPPNGAPKSAKSANGSSLRRAWSSQGRSTLGNESTLKYEVGPLPALDCKWQSPLGFPCI